MMDDEEFCYCHNDYEALAIARKDNQDYVSGQVKE